MAPKDLARHDRDRAAERRRAERWLSEHGFTQNNRVRSATGSERGDLKPHHRDEVSYDQFDTLAQWEDWMLDGGRDYVPLVSGFTLSSLESIEKRARMAHVLTFILPAHVELLYDRHVAQRTLDSIAAEHFVTRQAIIKRLRVAEQDFRKQFGLHWNDNLDPREVLRAEDR